MFAIYTQYKLEVYCLHTRTDKLSMVDYVLVQKAQRSNSIAFLCIRKIHLRRYQRGYLVFWLDGFTSGKCWEGFAEKRSRD